MGLGDTRVELEHQSCSARCIKSEFETAGLEDETTDSHKKHDPDPDSAQQLSALASSLRKLAEKSSQYLENAERPLDAHGNPSLGMRLCREWSTSHQCSWGCRRAVVAALPFSSSNT